VRYAIWLLVPHRSREGSRCWQRQSPPPSLPRARERRSRFSRQRHSQLLLRMRGSRRWSRWPCQHHSSGSRLKTQLWLRLLPRNTLLHLKLRLRQLPPPTLLYPWLLLQQLLPNNLLHLKLRLRQLHPPSILLYPQPQLQLLPPNNLLYTHPRLRLWLPPPSILPYHQLLLRLQLLLPNALRCPHNPPQRHSSLSLPQCK